MNGRALILVVLVVAGVCVATVNQRSSAPADVHTMLGGPQAVPGVPDDTLRRTIARAIYGHPAFWRDAAMPEPPIQILVNDGHVILTGTVAGELERALASSLARGHGEASVTNQLHARAARFN